MRPAHTDSPDAGGARAAGALREVQVNAGRETAACGPWPGKAIALRLEAIALRLEVIALRLEAIALRLEAIALRLKAIALRLGAIALRLEAIATLVGGHCYLGWRPLLLRLEAIAT